jgi:hypothetical protein
LNLDSLKLIFRNFSNYINNKFPYKFSYEYKLANVNIPSNLQNYKNNHTMMMAKRPIRDRDEELNDMDIYLRANSSSGNEGIVSNKLKGVVFGVVSIILIFFGIASYLNSQNPIIDLLREANKPFAVNMIDENYIKYFNSTTKNYTKRDYKMPQTLKNAALGLHYNLQKLIPNEKCPVYLKKIDYFKDYACEMSYQYFILNIMLGENSNLADRSFISTIINSNQALKEYLLLSWMKSNMNDDDFYNLFFSNSYYGNAVVGAHTASDYYFKKEPEDLDLAESIFLIYKVYNQNASFYTPNPDVTYDSILESLIEIDIISSEDIPELKDSLSQIQDKQVVNSFMRYIEEDFLEAYKLFRTNTVVTIKTTFLLALQNALIKITTIELEKHNIPNASFLIIKNNDIFSSFTLGLEKDDKGKSKPLFYPTFPDVKTYSAIKPFLFLTLLENKVDISTVLINFKYQNLIFTYNLYTTYQNEESKLQTQENLSQKDEPTEPLELSQGSQVVTSTNGKISIKKDEGGVSNINILSNTNLDEAPDSIRKYFVAQLNDLEKSFMLRLEANKYKAGLKKYDLDIKNIETTQDLIDRKGILSLEKIFYAYTSFLNYGEMRNSRHINIINQEPFPFESQILGTYNKDMINLLKGLYFNKIEFKNSKSILYYVLDVNFGVLFSDEYLAIFWFGDFNNPDVADVNYMSSLQVMLKALTDLLRN